MELDALTASMALIITHFALVVVAVGALLVIPRDRTAYHWAITSVLMSVGSMFLSFAANNDFPTGLFFVGAVYSIQGGVSLWWGTQTFFGKKEHRLGWIISIGFLLAFGLAVILKIDTEALFSTFSVCYILLTGLHIFEIVRGQWGQFGFATWLILVAHTINIASQVGKILLVCAIHLPPSSNNIFSVSVFYLMPLAAVFLCSVGIIFLYFNRIIDQKDRLAHYDELTELYNRRALMEHGRKAVATMHRTKRPLSLLLIDIDYFKQINDSYGHATGDAVLHKVASYLKATCRASDHVGRYGGEEFCIICPDTNQAQAVSLAERLLHSVRKMPIAPMIRRSLTISIGITVSTDPEISWDKMLDDADTGLYGAKAAGRNRYVLAHEILMQTALGAEEEAVSAKQSTLR